MDAASASEKCSDDELESMIDDSDDFNDEDFMNVEEPVTPESKPCKIVTPKAPEKEDLMIGGNIVVAVKARSC